MPAQVQAPRPTAPEITDGGVGVGGSVPLAGHTDAADAGDTMTLVSGDCGDRPSASAAGHESLPHTHTATQCSV